MSVDKLIHELLELAKWADSHIYEVPIHLPATLRDAADVIEDLTENLNFR